MQIGFWHSNLGGSPMMIGLQRGLESLSHNVVTAHAGDYYDILVVWNQIAHDSRYQYPSDLPRHGRMVFIDGAEYGWAKRGPGVIHEYANAFSPGSVNHDTKNVHQQAHLRQLVEGRSFPYLVREKSKFIEWPASYFGVNYPLYLHSEDTTPPNRDEFLSRSVAFWQSWGMSNPTRWPITHALRAAGYECLALEEETPNGPTPRMPHNEYFPRMRAAMSGCSYDGYGSSSFRRTELLCRCVLLEGPLTVDFPYPLTDGVNVVQYSVEVDEQGEFISTDIAGKIQRIKDDPEWAFEVYRNGFDHCWTYFTERALAEYVLNVIEGHDYSQVTPLDIA